MFWKKDIAATKLEQAFERIYINRYTFTEILGEGHEWGMEIKTNNITCWSNRGLAEMRKTCQY